MKPYKKSLIGTVLTLLIGTSCCWMSSIIFGLGGIAMIGTVIEITVHLQKPLVFLSGILGLLTISRFLAHRRNITKKKSE